MSKEQYSQETENPSDDKLKKFTQKAIKWAAIIGVGALILAAL